MFNRKLKNRILELEKQVSDAKIKIKDQETEIKNCKWQLDNPPKYKTGDKIGDLIVVEKKFSKPELKDILGDAIVITWIMLQRMAKKDTKQLAEFVVKTVKCQWEYQLLNTTTGEKLLKKELELEMYSAELKKTGTTTNQ